MNIAIINHRIVHGDGQGRVNYELAKAALQRGHRVTMVAGEVADDLRSFSHASWTRLEHKRPPTALLRNELFVLRSTRWVANNAHAFDIVQANGYLTRANVDVSTAHFVHGAWLRSPVHPIHLSHNPRSIYQWGYTQFNARTERIAFRRSKVVVAVSNTIRTELMSIGIDDHSIRVIPNGVDTEEFQPGHTDRESLGLPKLGVLALFVGDIRTPRKNLESVLRALPAVADLHLIVVGSTDGSPYPRLADALGVADRVRFLGFRGDIASIMRSVDLFVFPSRYEANSLVLLEALASGLAVVTAKTAGAVEYILPECGIVLDSPDNVEGLASAMRLLANDPTLRLGMGNHARRISQQHTWEIMAERYLELYEQIVREKPAIRGTR